MAENDSNPRDDVAAAYDAAVAATEAPTPEVPAEVVATPTDPVGESAEEKAARVRDEKGRFAPKIGDKAPPKVEEAPKVEAKDKPPAEPTPTPETPKPERQVPRSLPAPLREAWKKLDDVERDYLIKREGEVVRITQESAQARQSHEKFKETISPYEQLFRAEGVEPLQGIGNLMRTTAALATGAPQTKAQIVASIIKTYGVDIATLDALLAGQGAPPQQAYQQPPPREFRDPRLDALLEQQTQRTRQQAAEAIAEVEQQEFFEDVRDEMADILEVASRRGIAMTAEQAYNRAIAINPETSRVIDQRRAAANQGSTQRAREAASSIKAQPATGVESTADRGVYGAVEDAWNKAQGR
jgi:hypothetical protein